VVSDGKKDSQADTVVVTLRDQEGNRRPVADAGGNQMVDELSTVTLNGSASYDPDGQPLSFRWSQIAGPAVVLSDGGAVRPSFVLPDINQITLFTFELWSEMARWTASRTP